MLRTAEAFTNAALVEGFEGVLLASTFAGMQHSLGERVQGSGPELRDSNRSLREEMKKGRRAETLRGRMGRKRRRQHYKTCKWATHGPQEEQIEGG